MYICACHCAPELELQVFWATQIGSWDQSPILRKQVPLTTEPFL